MLKLLLRLWADQKRRDFKWGRFLGEAYFFALFMMISISPVLALIVLVTIPISVSYTVYIKKKTRPLFIKRSKSYGSMNGFVEEMFSGEKTIQA